MSAEPVEKATRDPYIVGPIERALSVLIIVGRRSSTGISLAELASEARMPKSTVFRYLRTFLDGDFVAHDPAVDTYRLGRAVWRLAYQSGEQRVIQQVIVPEMSKLMALFDETINFGVVNGPDVEYLEILECSRSLRMQAALGGRDPLHSTALGKALLAAMPGNTWRRVVPAHLPSVTDVTVRTLNGLATEIDHIRETGYAFEHGENEEGATCIAAAITAPEGPPLGAISLSAPTVRVTPLLEAEIAAAIRAAAGTCSAALFSSSK